MNRERAARPLVILGATASGKSELALGVADLIEGVELISIDSMQIYRGMNVGTATPTAEEQARARHHLIDLVEPTEMFSVGEFQRLARSALAEIRARDGVPVLVGGTGLYLRAVIDDLEIPDRYPSIREELEQEPDVVALHTRLSELDPTAASRMEPGNRRRIIRALEVTIGSGRPFSSFGPGLETYAEMPFVQVALRWPRETLHERIAARYERQLSDGFVEEVRGLADLGLSRTAAHALGYREVLRHLDGECSLAEAMNDAIIRTRQFARRQHSWFRRDPRIRWVDMPATAGDLVGIWDEVLAKDGG
jgi:tRNA dimethylallyltransferase